MAPFLIIENLLLILLPWFFWIPHLNLPGASREAGRQRKAHRFGLLLGHQLAFPCLRIAASSVFRTSLTRSDLLDLMMLRPE